MTDQNGVRVSTLAERGHARMACTDEGVMLNLVRCSGSLDLVVAGSKNGPNTAAGEVAKDATCPGTELLGEPRLAAYDCLSLDPLLPLGNLVLLLMLRSANSDPIGCCANYRRMSPCT